METERPDTHNDKFLDELLDASLAQYGRTEPRVGLEGRVLRRMEEAQQTRSLGWFGGWRWAVAGACVVVLVSTAALLSLRDRSARPNRAQEPAEKQSTTATTKVAPPQAVVSAAQVTGLVVPSANRAPRFNRVRPDVAAVAAVPRLAVFPAPAPLSNQEILLARTAATANPVMLEALARASQAPVQDLEIAPIKIEPLPGSEETPNPGSVPKP